MNKLSCILCLTMLFYMIVMHSENSQYKDINSNLLQSLEVIKRSFDMERETFKACERGELEEYRQWKRRTLG